MQYVAFFNGHDALELDDQGIYMLDWVIFAAASAWGAAESTAPAVEGRT